MWDECGSNIHCLTVTYGLSKVNWLMYIFVQLYILASKISTSSSEDLGNWIDNL
jgi:hypothetical protein